MRSGVDVADALALVLLGDGFAGVTGMRLSFVGDETLARFSGEVKGTGTFTGLRFNGDMSEFIAIADLVGVLGSSPCFDGEIELRRHRDSLTYSSILSFTSWQESSI